MAARQLASQTVPTSASSNVLTTGAVGTANGVAGLGADSKVAQSQLPTPKITVGTSAPSSPSVGDLWVDTN